jgi:hypothetical protein
MGPDGPPEAAPDIAPQSPDNTGGPVPPGANPFAGMRPVK